jgi:hypothetical protein
MDNASSDGSAEMLAAASASHADFLFLQNAANLGFPRAANQGLAQARAPYVLLLNPDILLAPGALDRMLALLASRPDIGAVGPMVRFPEGAIQLQCARRLPRLLDFVASRFGLSRFLPCVGLANTLMTDWDHRDSREVECLLGACILMRTEELRRLGGLREEMYLEDMELCWQVKHVLGKRVYYLVEAEAVHHHHVSFQAVTDRKLYLWISEQLDSAPLKFFLLHSGGLTVALARLAEFVSGLLKTVGLTLALGVVAWRKGTRERVLRALFRSYVRLCIGVRGVSLAKRGQERAARRA